MNLPDFHRWWLDARLNFSEEDSIPAEKAAKLAWDFLCEDIRNQQVDIEDLQVKLETEGILRENAEDNFNKLKDALRALCK